MTTIYTLTTIYLSCVFIIHDLNRRFSITTIISRIYIMILSIPYTVFDVSNIHLTNFIQDKYGKTIAKLTYKDKAVDFHDISIYSPPLKVIDYNPDNSRLRLDLSECINFQIKINTLYEYIINTLYIHQYTFLNYQNVPQEYIRHLFYFIVDGSVLSLYIYPTAFISKGKNIHARVSELKPGDIISCIIRLQGVSQVSNRNDLRLRLHHSVPSIWYVS